MQNPTPEKRAMWEERISQQKASTLTANQWCREHQINRSIFYAWKRRLFPTPAKPPIGRSNFVELPNEKKQSLTLEYRGTQIHLQKHYDPNLLKQTLLLIRETL